MRPVFRLLLIAAGVAASVVGIAAACGADHGAGPSGPPAEVVIGESADPRASTTPSPSASPGADDGVVDPPPVITGDDDDDEDADDGDDGDDDDD
ncbi:hypothetical protein [Marinactinospora rubrisoli]|uniref:Small secreted hydrophilic protein n=1 Tax=Marinactinospora rubrisoli TaxID=2715399 RepID=A0ABW2KPZ0_9ACTN